MKRYYLEAERNRRSLAKLIFGFVGLLAVMWLFVSLMNDQYAAWVGMVLLAMPLLWLIYVFLTPKEFIEIDQSLRSATLHRKSTEPKKLQLDQLAPLEAYEYVVRGRSSSGNSSITTRWYYGVRSQAMPDLVLFDNRYEDKARQQLKDLGESLQLKTVNKLAKAEPLPGTEEYLELHPEEESEKDLEPVGIRGQLIWVFIFAGFGYLLLFLMADSNINCQRQVDGVVNCQHRLSIFGGIPIWQRSISAVQRAYMDEGAVLGMQIGLLADTDDVLLLQNSHNVSDTDSQEINRFINDSSQTSFDLNKNPRGMSFADFAGSFFFLIGVVLLLNIVLLMMGIGKRKVQLKQRRCSKKR